MNRTEVKSALSGIILFFALSFMIPNNAIFAGGFDVEKISVGFQHGTLSSFGPNTKNSFWPTSNDRESGRGLFVQYDLDDLFLSLRGHFLKANNTGRSENNQFYGHIQEFSMQAHLNLNVVKSLFSDGGSEKLINEHIDLYLYTGIGYLDFDVIMFSDGSSRNLAQRSAAFYPFGLGLQINPNFGKGYANNFYFTIESGFRYVTTDNIDGSIVWGVDNPDPLRRLYNFSSIGIGFSPQLLSANENFVFRTRPFQSIYFSFSAGESAIFDNRMVSLDELHQNINVSNGFGVQIEAGYMKRFLPLFSYGLGIKYSNYSTTFLSSRFEGRDVFNFTGAMTGVSYEEIREELDVNLISFPFFLEFGNTNINGWGYYSQAGLSLDFMASSNFSGTGKIIQNNVSADLYTDRNPELNNIQISGFLAAGISRALSGQNISPWILRAGLYYTGGISNIVENAGYDFRYSDMKPSDFMGFNTNSSSLTRHVGFQLGIQYLIGDPY